MFFAHKPASELSVAILCQPGQLVLHPSKSQETSFLYQHPDPMMLHEAAPFTCPCFQRHSSNVRWQYKQRAILMKK